MLGLEKKWMRWILMISVMIGLIISANVVVRRVQFDQENRHVQSVISYRDMQKLAIISGERLDSLLKEIIETTGITSITVEEETLADFENAGKVNVLKGSDIQNLYHVGHVSNYILSYIYKNVRIDENRFYIIVQEQADYERIRDFLTAEYGQDRVKRISRSRNILEVLDTREGLFNVGMGIPTPRVNKLEEMGFNVLIRLRNSQRVSRNVVIQKFTNIDTMPSANTIIFDGDSVLGFPNELEFTQQKLTSNQYRIAAIEFAKQKGFPYLAKRITNHVIRLHSIPEEVMTRISLEKATKRYLRAAKERNITMLFIHPFLDSQGSGLQIKEKNITFLKNIQEGITRIGLIPSVSKTPSDMTFTSVQSWEIFFISLSVFALFLLFISHYMYLTTTRTLVISGLFGIIFYGCHLLGITLHWTRGISMFAAILFPTYALISRFPSETQSQVMGNRRFKAMLTYLITTVGITVSGGIVVSALMSDISFLIGISLFYGVKLSFIIPIILIGIYFYLRPHRLTSVYFIAKRLFYAPIRTSSLLAVLLCVGFVAIYLLRSGNYLSFQIPFVEEYMRDILEEWLFVRPRTKEFLIGYPFLLITFYYADRGISRNWLWFYNMIGSVSLISIMNSFCHLHTPVLVSLYRTFLGLVLGVIITTLYWLCLKVGKLIQQQLLVR